MSIVAPQQRIASAFVVIFGNYGDVSRYAQQRGVCRQWVYREAGWVQQHLHEPTPTIQCLRQQVHELQKRQLELEQRLAVAVILDPHKQQEFACVGQALGVSLPTCRDLLEVLIPGQAQSVATLGRAAKAAGDRAGQLLPVLDAWARERVRDAAVDEIYVTDPVLMVVEQESLCWMTGRLSAAATGDAWAQELRPFANLEQVARDGGAGLAKGVAQVNAERLAQGQPLLVDQGDHFHALRGGRKAFRPEERRAREALAEAEAAQKALEGCRRQGTCERIATIHANAAWRRAEKAMDTWSAREQLWQQTKEALRLFTPEGELNTRARAEAVLAQTVPQLPDAFAKIKRHVQQPEMLNYLDHVQRQLEALPFPAAVKAAAVRQEGLRRRPELRRGDGTPAAALRGVLLACAVVIAKAGDEGAPAQAAVQEVLRRAYRASSLVECINSVLRMQQARHRNLTQGLLDLKRLYWNCHTFRTGRRRDTTPYQRLGMPWPEGLRWWDLLKLTPEQLRDKLSTAKTAK
jgi:hypothetical protein